MNTSPPRMFSLKRTDTSPSSKRDTTTSPSGTLRRAQMACASRWLAEPAKMLQGSNGPRGGCGSDVRCVLQEFTAGQPEASPPAPGAEMAGAGGFEPPYARAKVSCLTAWPRPTNERGFRYGPFHHEVDRGESRWPREQVRGKAGRGKTGGRGRGQPGLRQGPSPA